MPPSGPNRSKPNSGGSQKATNRSVTPIVPTSKTIGSKPSDTRKVAPKNNPRTGTPVAKQLVPTGTDSQRRTQSVNQLAQTIKGAGTGAAKGVGQSGAGKYRSSGSIGGQTPVKLSPNAGTADKNSREGSAQLAQTIDPETGRFYTPDVAVERGLVSPENKDAYQREIYDKYQGAADKYYGGEISVNAQTDVGGTKGSAQIVDRSAAVKKAWETRKKLYGSSGSKAN